MDYTIGGQVPMEVSTQMEKDNPANNAIVDDTKKAEIHALI